VLVGLRPSAAFATDEQTRDHYGFVSRAVLPCRAAPVPCSLTHALRAFTDSLRSELIHEGLTGIHLTMVQLPALNTPQFGWWRSHMPRRAQPVPLIFQ
jgi:hypothetical protein